MPQPQVSKCQVAIACSALSDCFNGQSLSLWLPEFGQHFPSKPAVTAALHSQLCNRKTPQRQVQSHTTAWHTPRAVMHTHADTWKLQQASKERCVSVSTALCQVTRPTANTTRPNACQPQTTCCSIFILFKAIIPYSFSYWPQVNPNCNLEMYQDQEDSWQCLV